MGFGNNWNWGNKGSNFNFQKRLLQMYADCCAVPVFVPPPPPVFNTIWYTNYPSSSGPQPDNIYNDDTGISGQAEAAAYMVNNYGVGGCMNQEFGNVILWCVNDVAPTFTIYDISLGEYVPHTWLSTVIQQIDCYEAVATVSSGNPVTGYYIKVLTCPPVGAIRNNVGTVTSYPMGDPQFAIDFPTNLITAFGPQCTYSIQFIGSTVTLKILNNILALGTLNIEDSISVDSPTVPFTTSCSPPPVGTIIWKTEYDSPGGVLPDDCFQNPPGGISSWEAAAAYMQNNFTQGGMYNRPGMGLWCLDIPSFSIYELGCVIPVPYFRSSVLVPPAATCYQISDTPVDALIDCSITNMVVTGLGTIYTYKINVTIGDPGFEAAVQAAMPVYLGTQISATVDITGNTFTIKISGNILPIVSMNYYNVTTEITVLATTPCTP